VYKSRYPRCGCVRADSLGIANYERHGTPEELAEQYVLPSSEDLGRFPQEYYRQPATWPPSWPPPFHASAFITSAENRQRERHDALNAALNATAVALRSGQHQYQQQQGQQPYQHSQLDDFYRLYQPILGLDTNNTSSYDMSGDTIIDNEDEVRELRRENQRLKEQLHDAKRVSGPDSDAMRLEAARDQPYPYFINGTPSYLVPRLERQPFRADIQDTQEEIHEQILEKGATEPTSMEANHDYTTTADSGYHSGTRNSCTNLGEGDPNETDTDSVVTDGWPSSLPRQDKYMLEAEFAREIFNHSSAWTREQFVKRGQTVKDLLYSFSVMMWGRATSAAERGAASFVRHGRKYVPSDPDSHPRDCPYAHMLIS
jgi:hypothetical protein